MQGSDFDEEGFFRSLRAGGARALLIGRKALVVLGLPVLTADYDLWLHRDDVERFNDAALPFGLYPSREPDEARRRGRYVLENDERVDVLVARSVTTVDGEVVHFDDVWERRREVTLTAGVRLAIPCLDDLITTSPHVSPGFVARAARCSAQWCLRPEGRGGVLDSTPSTPRREDAAGCCTSPSAAGSW